VPVGATDELTITWNFWPAASVTVSGENVVLSRIAVIIGAPPPEIGRLGAGELGVLVADGEDGPAAAGLLVVVALPQADSAAVTARMAAAVMTSERTFMAASKI
jgi:hypothetical protein